MRHLFPAAVFLLAVPAAAQVPAPPSPSEAPAAARNALADFAKTETYKRLQAQALARVPASVLPRCPKLVLSPVALVPGTPLRFAPDKSLVGGNWQDSQLARGCGPEVQVNFFFFGTPDRRTLTVVGVPGTSRADLSQQRDARTYALLALDGVAGNCRSFDTVGTRFEGWGSKEGQPADPGEGAAFRPWWETWTMAGCGKRWDVPLDFRPNRLGTQIVQPGGVQERHSS